MKKILYLALMLGWSCLASAQAISFSSELDTNRILIGEAVRLELRGSVARGAQFFWPALPDTLAALEVLETGALDTTIAGDRWELRQQISLTAFDSGYFAIPALILAGEDGEARSSALALAVDFPELDEAADYRDIEPPLEAPFNWWVLLLTALVLLAAALGVWMLLRYLRHRKVEAQLTPEQRLSPYALARKQLNELAAEKPYREGRVKEYYSRLSDILRLYLQREMRLRAMESTADEVVIAVNGLAVDAGLKERVALLMRLSAMVKYAKQKPSDRDHELSLQTVEEFVERTHQAKVEESAANRQSEAKMDAE